MKIRITSAKPGSLEIHKADDPYSNNSFSHAPDPLVELVRQLKNAKGSLDERLAS